MAQAPPFEAWGTAGTLVVVLSRKDIHSCHPNNHQGEGLTEDPQIAWIEP
jgi:hypothetical protein